MPLTETPPPSAPRAGFLQRWGFLCFCIVLFAAIALAYHTSLKHVPRADQWILLLDTIDHHEFTDLVAHSYSYSRTRIIYAGDTQLFRPLFFVLLSAERAYFGNDFRLWHAAGVLLHFLAVVLLLRAMLRMQTLFAPAGDPPTERRSWFASGQPIQLAPYALALFFALNYAGVEQVIWFNINGYILFVVLVLGSFLCLLEAAARPELSPRARRLYLAGAWLLTLLAAFTYEMGQFYALLAGLFLLVVFGTRERWRRALLVAAAFMAITFLYQTANHLDRWHHQGQFKDDVVVSDLTGSLSNPATVEHWKRYLVYSLVQPFFPLNCRASMLPIGKCLLTERIWDGTIKKDKRLIPSIAVLALLSALMLAGLCRLVAARQWRWLLVVLFAGGIAFTHMSLIVFGRMNLRPVPGYWHLNHYYIYITLLFTLLTCSVLLAMLRHWKPGLPMYLANGAAVLLVLGLGVLAVSSGMQAHRINAQTARIFKPYRWMNNSLREFVCAHQHEPDFSFALRLDPADGLPSVTGVPCPVILYKRFINNAQPKYIVRFERFRAVALPTEDWRRQYPDDENAICPELVEIGASHHIFRHGDRYYAMPYNTAIGFVYARERVNYPGALHDDSLDGLRCQIEALKNPPRAAR